LASEELISKRMRGVVAIAIEPEQMDMITKIVMDGIEKETGIEIWREKSRGVEMIRLIVPPTVTRMHAKRYPQRENPLNVDELPPLDLG